jgi:hypothetical protein
MVKMIKGLKRAHCRGLILRLLFQEHPDTTAFLVLRIALAELFACPLLNKELASHLVYLEFGGYIKLARNSEGDILFGRIINKGINLLEGFISDPGILIG